MMRLGAFFGGGSSSTYDAVKQLWSRDRTWIDHTVKDSKHDEGRWTREVLMGLSRNLYGNVGFVRGAVGDLARYSVGEGITPYSASSDKAARMAYDAYWEQWGDICEVRQVLNWRQILKATSRAIDIDGDLGFVLTETIDSYPQIQAVEAHRIVNQEDGNGWSNGVKVNGLNRPVAYQIRVVQAEGDDRFVTIPASSFVHVFEPDRLDGCRGLSALKHAILHIRDKKDIIAFEKLGVKNAASIANVITMSNASDLNGPVFGGQTNVEVGTNQNVTFEQLREGALVKLKQGEDLKSFSSDRPSPTFTGFLDYIDRDVAVGLGLPVEFIWNSKDLGGTSQRFILQKAQRTFEDRQEILCKLIKRVRNYVIAKGIKRGDLPKTDDWWRIEIQGPTKITVDVGREAAANRDDVRAGLRTEQEDFRERGKRWETARKDIQEAADDLIVRAKALVAAHPEINLQTAIQLMQQRTAGGGQIMIESPRQANAGKEDE